MKWLLWFLTFASALLAIFIIARKIGATRWFTLTHNHRDQLETSRFEIQPGQPLTARYDINELNDLPPIVQRYFRTVLNDGQPIVVAARIELAGTMNMSTTDEQWKYFTSEQSVVTHRPGFLWNAKIRMFLGLPVYVEDSYIAGQGRLVARVLGLFTMANAHGGGELARGEFMRYFAEAVWYPTALLPSQGVAWQAVDNTSANATIVDGFSTLTLLFKFNSAGLVDSVLAESRGFGIGQAMQMLPWNCQFSDYKWHSDMLVPMTGDVAWMHPTGRKSYFVGSVKQLKYEFCK